MALFSPFAGRLSDKIEPRIVATLGMAVTTLSLGLFVLLDEHSSVKFIVANLILLGFGLALFSSPNTNAIMSSVEKRFYGLASGSVGTMRLLGMMISMGVVTLVFTLFIGKVQITTETSVVFIKSAKIAFIIFTILCLGGTWASLVRGNVLANMTKRDQSLGREPLS